MQEASKGTRESTANMTLLDDGEEEATTQCENKAREHERQQRSQTEAQEEESTH